MFGLKARSLGRREGRTAPSPCVESLENRRLLSADLGGAFVGHVPAILLPASKQPIIIRLTNHGDAPAAGPVTVSLYASQDGSLNGGDALLGQVARNMKLKPGKSVNLKVRANPAATLSKGTYQLLARIDDSALTGSTKAGGTQ